MSDLPELRQDLASPIETDPQPSASTDLTPPFHHLGVDDGSSQPQPASPDSGQVDPAVHFAPPDAPLLFQQYLKPSEERIPHIGHLGLLFLLGLLALALTAVLGQVAITLHLFGVTDLQQAATEIHFLLGTQALLYLFTYIGSILVFPRVWHKGFFAGLQWRGNRALQRSGYLIFTAAVCFSLAMVDGYFFPGPSDAPIDRIFRMPGAAWILFAFGVTFAPFFEEIAFRGFLLPALSTTYDWMAEKILHHPRPALDFNGHPQWSMPAMASASLVTSIAFALMHADQTSYSIGPFVLLIVVSLVLCAARLRLRSLAASVLLHAAYNFLLFSFMLIGTSGFRHLDKM